MKNLVVIALHLPESQSTAAGFRMMQLLSIFEKWNFKITFLSTSPSSEFSDKVAYQVIQLNDDQFNFQLSSLNPEIVLFDRFVAEEQFGWRVSEVCPNALKILDTEDLHFLREARRKAFIEKRETTETDLLNDIFKREMASILRCDLSLIISDFEFNILTEKFRVEKQILFYLPFLMQKNTPDFQGFEQRENFMSIGNFLHEPNWHTTLYLKKIWKNIREILPKAELHIFGAYASQKVFQLQSEKEGFFIKGRTEQIKETFSKYRVMLAPIPYGAGLKGKLYESMLYGLPNVTTSMGAEGMKENELWNGFVEDDDEIFVEKAILLYTDKNTWKRMQENGNLLLQKRFSESLFLDTFKTKIENLQNHLQEYRKKNFLGQILQHHSLLSTKYLSKWIEEKNRK